MVKLRILKGSFRVVSVPLGQKLRMQVMLPVEPKAGAPGHRCVQIYSLVRRREWENGSLQ